MFCLCPFCDSHIPPSGNRDKQIRQRRRRKDSAYHRWLHPSGPDKVGPRCIECQLKSGNAGDFVLIGGPGITLDGEDKQNVEKQFVVAPKKEPSSEKPAGQWNEGTMSDSSLAVRLPLKMSSGPASKIADIP